MPAPPAIDEDQARRLMLVRAFDAASEGPLWTAEDRRWASRAALQSLGDDAPRERLLVERASLALQRLAPRDAGVRRALDHALWRPAWLGLGVAAALALGVLSDALLAGPYFNLLSPALLGLLVWNLGVYIGSLAQAARAGAAAAGPAQQGAARVLMRWLRRLGRQGPLADFATRWTRQSLPLSSARAALLMHVGAAALAAGLVLGMYGRALVFDYRAGWATTLLEPGVVRALLAGLLAPASALTGLVVPDVAGIASLRVTPDAPAHASAAPWIHLMAVTLALAVVVPRLVLAWRAARRARSMARDFPVDWTDAAFDRLWPRRGRASGALWVQPHGQALAAQTAIGLRAALARVFGDAVRLQVAAPVAYGDEGAPPSAPLPEGRALALFDLATTPEDEVQGRLVRALPGQPAVLVDTAAFARRFGRSERWTQRRAAWAAWAGGLGVPLAFVDLEADPSAVDDTSLRDALEP